MSGFVRSIVNFVHNKYICDFSAQGPLLCGKHDVVKK